MDIGGYWLCLTPDQRAIDMDLVDASHRKMAILTSDKTCEQSLSFAKDILWYM